MTNLNMSQLIAQMILERRERGATLSYDDYSVINDWVSHCDSNDQLLLLIANELSNTLSDSQVTGLPIPLKRIRKRILRKIKEYRSLSEDPHS